MKTIDMTPTWAEIAPTFALVLENAKEAGKAKIRPELQRMAALADERNAMAKQRAAAIDTLETVDTLHKADPSYLSRDDLAQCVSEALAALRTNY